MIRSFFILIFGIVLIVSCKKDRYETKANVIFSTNAQAVLNCGSFGVEICIDNSLVGTIEKPFTSAYPAPDCNSTRNEQFLALEKPAGVYKYTARISCFENLKYSGEFIVEEDGCTFVYIDLTYGDLNNSCFSQWRYSPDSILISEDEHKAIIKLFEINNIDYDNLIILKATQYSPTGMYIYCDQFVNGLRLFHKSIGFHFDPEGNFKSIVGGDRIKQINLDTTPRLNYQYLIKTFKEEFEEDTLWFPNIYVPSKDILLDGCFLLEYGYYDLNSGTPKEANYTKAWRVHPENRIYPVAYIDDVTAELIDYWNGNEF